MAKINRKPALIRISVKEEVNSDAANTITKSFYETNNTYSAAEFIDSFSS